MKATTATPDNNQKFIDKQGRLNTALQKVKTHLQYLLDKYDSRRIEFKELKDEEKKEVDKWNEWHDLQDRIEGRLIENYQAAQQWHFEKFGWAVIKD